MKAGAQLANLILFLIIYLHFYACVLWILVKDNKTWTPYYLQEDFQNNLDFLYFDESTSVFSKYLVVLYQAVQAMGGGDFCPENITQVIMASIGVFMAAYINANIFGELQMLLQALSLETDSFDLKKAQIDTTIIKINLP